MHNTMVTGPAQRTSITRSVAHPPTLGPMQPPLSQQARPHLQLPEHAPSVTFPMGHGVQRAAPARANVPGAQQSQAVEVGLGTLPAGQGVHADAPSPLTVPVEHGHRVSRWPRVQKLPAGHGAHTQSGLANFPAAHTSSQARACASRGRRGEGNVIIIKDGGKPSNPSASTPATPTTLVLPWTSPPLHDTAVGCSMDPWTVVHSAAATHSATPSHAGQG